LEELGCFFNTSRVPARLNFFGKARVTANPALAPSPIQRSLALAILPDYDPVASPTGKPKNCGE
jgi:hypothetical protein